MPKKSTVYEIFNITDRGHLDRDVVAKVYQIITAPELAYATTTDVSSTDLSKMFHSWIGNERSLASLEERHQAAMRRADQFTNWWIGVKEEYNGFQRLLNDLLIEAGRPESSLGLSGVRDALDETRALRQTIDAQNEKIKQLESDLADSRALEGWK